MGRSHLKKRLTVGRLLQYVFIYSLVIIVLLPVCNIFISAFKTNVEINRSIFFPEMFRLDNFIKVFKTDILYTGMLNSVIITTGSLAVSLLLSALAAYPLARNSGKIYLFIYLFFLSANMIPTVANLTSLYSIMQKFHLIDTRIGLILLYGSRVSMGILLFTSFYKTIPREIMEAAEIDGCNYFQAFIRVVFPMIKPVSITYIMVNIFSVWNDFLVPQLFLPSRNKQTVTMALYTFTSEMGSDWGAVFALMAVSSLIPMIVFVKNQKYFFEGMAIGAVKG